MSAFWATSTSSDSLLDSCCCKSSFSPWSLAFWSSFSCSCCRKSLFFSLSSVFSSRLSFNWSCKRQFFSRRLAFSPRSSWSCCCNSLLSLWRLACSSRYPWSCCCNSLFSLWSLAFSSRFSWSCCCNSLFSSWSLAFSHRFSWSCLLHSSNSTSMASSTDCNLLFDSSNSFRSLILALCSCSISIVNVLTLLVSEFNCCLIMSKLDLNVVISSAWLLCRRTRSIVTFSISVRRRAIIPEFSSTVAWASFSRVIVSSASFSNMPMRFFFEFKSVCKISTSSRVSDSDLLSSSTFSVILSRSYSKADIRSWWVDSTSCSNVASCLRSLAFSSFNAPSAFFWICSNFSFFPTTSISLFSSLTIISCIPPINSSFFCNASFIASSFLSSFSFKSSTFWDCFSIILAISSFNFHRLPSSPLPFSSVSLDCCRRVSTSASKSVISSVDFSKRCCRDWMASSLALNMERRLDISLAETCFAPDNSLWNASLVDGSSASFCNLAFITSRSCTFFSKAA